MSRLLVIAHPDDEVVFLWPFMEGDCSDLTILCCTSDLNNLERDWCKYRKRSLIKIAEIKGAEVECLDYSSDLCANLKTRREPGMGDETAPYRMAIDHISKRIGILSSGVDYVATHNPMGEYGHLDHKLVFDTVMRSSSAEVRFTDICMPTNWQKENKIPPKIKEIFYKEKVSEHSINDNFLALGKRLYELENGWTWTRPIPNQCATYRI